MGTAKRDKENTVIFYQGEIQRAKEQAEAAEAKVREMIRKQQDLKEDF